MWLLWHEEVRGGSRDGLRTGHTGPGQLLPQLGATECSEQGGMDLTRALWDAFGCRWKKHGKGDGDCCHRPFPCSSLPLEPAWLPASPRRGIQGSTTCGWPPLGCCLCQEYPFCTTSPSYLSFRLLRGSVLPKQEADEVRDRGSWFPRRAKPCSTVGSFSSVRTGLQPRHTCYVSSGSLHTLSGL